MRFLKYIEALYSPGAETALIAGCADTCVVQMKSLVKHLLSEFTIFALQKLGFWNFDKPLVGVSSLWGAKLLVAF